MQELKLTFEIEKLNLQQPVKLYKDRVHALERHSELSQVFDLYDQQTSQLLDTNTSLLAELRKLSSLSFADSDQMKTPEQRTIHHLKSTLNKTLV